MKTLLHFFLFMVTIMFIQLCVEAIPVHSRCDEDQQSLLLHLKDTLIFNSSASSKLIYWNSSTNCCSWAGVSCTDGHVIGLDISEESISGGIDNSSTLFDLQHLQSLNLAYSYYPNNGSQIPSAIGRLTNLRYLNLARNSYFGQIPIEISHLTKLVTLDLSWNGYFDGTQREQLKLKNPNLSILIQNLTELTELYLDDVNISSAHGAHWSQAISSSLPNLKVLSLRQCDLSGPIHQSFAKLQSLSVLVLDNNDISAPVPGFFSNFSSLTSLSLRSCKLYGTFPEEIFHITTLQEVYLSSNPQLQGSLPKSIGNLKMLSALDLSGCSFTGSIPNSVANLTQLTLLDMSSNSFNGPIDSIHWENLVNLECLWLDYNLLNGSIPLSPFSLPVLSQLGLSHNKFYGQLPELANISSNLLDTLALSGNLLEGPIPTSIFNLRGLQALQLSSNHFSVFPFNGPQQPKNLSFLDLSNNSLLIDYNGSSPTSSSFLQINSLVLSSNKLKTFPDFLRNQSRLAYLNLAENQIQGEIPNWIWKLNSLRALNLSYNSLASLQGPLPNLTNTVDVIDLRSNNLQGQIPILYANYLDYSGNNFSSSIPADIGDNMLPSMNFFSLSSNNLHGIIPPSICNASGDLVLDLSNNSLSGMIPECLNGLGLLNLRSNNLTGPIPDKFVQFCNLTVLDLSRNQLQGQFPKSLVNCTQLEFLNLGNNQITDTFPCLLKNISTLRILVLRSNKFYGHIGCPEANGTWPVLQIIDLAYNNLSGEIPGTSMTTWKAMMDNEDAFLVNYFGFWYNSGGRSSLNVHYGDAVTITSKGSEMDLVKILSLFTLIDFSCNEFNGSIPEEMGELKSLYVLNLSCNAFTGEIPSSFGNMRLLESLDLSKNNLSGQIPTQLAKLTFLSFLNLSNNQLVGRIPTCTQFSTFTNASFADNKGLWGPPLTADDKAGLPVPPPASNESRRSSGHEINWDLISVEIGFVFGFGVAIGSLAFYKRWRNWYYKATLNIILKMFPQLHQRLGNQGRHVYINQRRRR